MGVLRSNSFLPTNRTVEDNMVIRQGALSDPKDTCNLASEDTINIEFELLDVESEMWQQL